MAARLDWLSLDAGVVLPALVLLVGIGLIVTAVMGERHPGLVALGVILAVATVVQAMGVPFGGGVGDRTFTPTASSLESSYELAAGNLVVDLTGVAFAGSTEIDVRVGFGEVLVKLPPDVRVTADGKALAGRVDLLGSVDEGLGVSRSVVRAGPEDGSQVVLHLSAVAGQIDLEVVRG
jgi:hypothetical protein